MLMSPWWRVSVKTFIPETIVKGLYWPVLMSNVFFYLIYFFVVVAVKTGQSQVEVLEKAWHSGQQANWNCLKAHFFSWTKEIECCALLLRPLGFSFYLREFQKVNNPGCKWCSNKPTRSKIDGTPTKRVRTTSNESNRLCCSFWAKQWDLSL